jgi:hypothetical protein
MGISIDDLGLSKEELADRVVDRIAQQVMASVAHDEDGEEYARPSKFAEAMRQQVKAKVDDAVEKIALRNVLPNVESFVENVCLQETNRWGEKTGQPLTFTEYLVQRANAYLTEDVNFEGKSKAESGSYGWSKAQNRITHLVHKHLHYSIETAMKTAVQNVQTGLATGLADTVRVKLNDIAAALKVEVKTGR